MVLSPKFNAANIPGLRQNAPKGNITALVQTWLVLTSNSSLAMVLIQGWRIDKRITESFVKALAKEQLVPMT